VREVFARTVAVHTAVRAGVTGAAIATALALSHQRVSLIRRTLPSNDVVAAADQLSALLLARSKESKPVASLMLARAPLELTLS
jgi:hypothetical protein